MKPPTPFAIEREAFIELNSPPSQPSLDERDELAQHTDLQLVFPDPHEPYDGAPAWARYP